MGARGTLIAAAILAAALALRGTGPAAAECNSGMPPPVDPDPEGIGGRSSGDPPSGETGGRTPPSPSGGGTPTPPPEDGGGGPPVPTPGSRPGPPTPTGGGKSPNMSEGGLEDWDDWWHVHQDRYLALRARIREADRAVATPLGAGPAPADGGADLRQAGREFLLASFRDPRWNVRAAAALALGRSGTVAALPEFARVGRARGRDVRGSAAVGSGLLGDTLVVDDLALVVTDPAEPEHLRGVTLLALGLIGGPDAAAALRGFLESPGHRTAMLEETAVAALGLARDPGSLPLLRRILSSGSRPDRVRALSATALARLGDRDSLPLLRQALRSDHAILRQAAAVACGTLGRPGDAAIVADLARAARDERDPTARRFSHLALGRIGGPAAGSALLTLLVAGRAPDLPFTALALGIGGFREAGPVMAGMFREAKDPGVRSALAISLGLLRWRASAPDLLDVARGRGGHHLRGDCLVALGLMDHRPAAAEARAVLEAGHPDEGLLADASACLALLGERAVLARLPGILRRGVDHAHRGGGYRVLGMAGEVASIPELAAIGGDRRVDDATRGRAIETVGALLDDHDVPVLASVAMDDHFLLFRGPLKAVVGHR